MSNPTGAASSSTPQAAARLVRKAPPQVPQPKASPEVGVHVAVRELRNVLRRGRESGFGAWAELAANLGMEDRTALAELLAVMSVVPPTNPPTEEERQMYMGRLFPQRTPTADGLIQVKAAPTPPPGSGTTTPTSTAPGSSSTAPAMPTSSTGPSSSPTATVLQQHVGAPPTAWASQVQWHPPPHATARDADQVSGMVFLDAPTSSTTRTAAAFLDPTEAREPETTASPTVAQSAMPSGTATPAFYFDAAGRRTRAPPAGARRPDIATGAHTPATTAGDGAADDDGRRRRLDGWKPELDDTGKIAAARWAPGHGPTASTAGGRHTPRQVVVPAVVSCFDAMAVNAAKPEADYTTGSHTAGGGTRPPGLDVPARGEAGGPGRQLDGRARPRHHKDDDTDGGTVQHLSDERIRQIEINMTDDYRQHKRAMHRRGARAVDEPPKSVKHLLRRTLIDVIAEENLDRQGIDGHKPKPPPTSAPTYCAYWFCSTLPANTRGARIPWQSQEAGRRVLGWCSHPCTSPHCPHLDDLYDVDTPGLGRCLRPVVEGNGRDHIGHETDLLRRQRVPLSPDFGHRVGAAEAVDGGGGRIRAHRRPVPLTFSTTSSLPELLNLGAHAARCLLAEPDAPGKRAPAPVMNQPAASSGPSATVADFFRDVASAGGSAYIATLARFGAINTPAVRDSFAVLLENGVPEGLLLQILAPVPPTQPEPTAARPPRHDVPHRRTLPRASLTAALEAMDPGRRQDTLAAIDANLLASSTRRAMESRVRTVSALADRGQFPLFPLDAHKLHTIAGAMKTGLYLDAVVWHQENTLHTPVTPGLRRVVKTLTKAAARGLPGSRLKQAFDLDELSKLVDDTAPFGPFNAGLVAHAVDVVIVATWFMLREVELAAARVRDLAVTLSAVSLDIPLHKTAQGGQADLTRRTFRCVCTSTAHPLCPRCAAHRHLRRIQASAAATPADFLFPTRPTVQRSKAESAEMFRLVLDAAGFETVYLDEQGKRRLIFGGHAARVAGATFLAMRGVPVAVIQLLGRWASTAPAFQPAPSTSTTTPAHLLPTGNAAGHADTAAPASQQMVPNVDFAAEVPGVEFVPEPARMPVADAIGDSAPRYVMNCRTKMVHKPGVDEASTERSDWQAKCGWPYGVRQFFRLSELPPDPALCRKCFPTETVDVEAPEAIDSSSSSSSSTSGATSDSD
ncbi:unnamed protein product [Symbiodinium sp. CCMP2592]|nr:unnamed protein product [Symbiodinium sp. CCMP2592]